MKEKIKAIQKKLGVDADGIMGKITLGAIMDALGISAPEPLGWPSQKEVRAGKSVFGAPGSKHLVRITPPYQLYYEGSRVSTIAVHERVAEAVQAALREVLEVYGAERIKALRLDEYGGCYNYRKTTSGSTLSMHAWGVALDFMPVGNEYSKAAPAAVLSGEAYKPWWEIWEKHGAVSMGRSCNKDWMHIQFATL